jgi:hypothetical protein
MTDSVAVYSANHPSSEKPDLPATDRETARSWKKAGTAYFINSGTAVRLVGTQTKPVAEEYQKSRWTTIPSGTPKIGYVSVLQLIT